MKNLADPKPEDPQQPGLDFTSPPSRQKLANAESHEPQQPGFNMTSSLPNRLL